MCFIENNTCEIEYPDQEYSFYDCNNPIIGLSVNAPGATSKKLSILIFLFNANYDTFPTSAINW